MAQKIISIFLDANVYFAGIFSKRGASALILELARQRQLDILASQLVLRETERNLRQEAEQKRVSAFHQFLRETKIHILTPLGEEVLTQYEPYIHPKDVPVLATALEYRLLH